MNKERWTMLGAVLLSGVALVGFGCLFGRSSAVPFPTEFWRIAAQPIATFLAAVVALVVGGLGFYGIHLSSDRARRSDVEALEDRRADARIQRCWSRFEWMVERASDATVPPELLTSFALNLSLEAVDTGDATLLDAVSDYAEHLLEAWEAPLRR
ncbi:hypothetical protein [Arthrobacter sp. SLBN-53]|uniref:hypothetical protein n=1 Tax=Arthrobacter sp. SLBN-53 TaxID=2768412 RepID=UPI00114F2774|nr:hypothetical protein [Arthrobacter sp. SLBN-53]